MLDLFDDANIYQTSAYGEVRWGEKNLSRLVLKRDGEIMGMAQLRIIRPTPLKFGMAYLRWGPLWERGGLPLDPEVPTRMARAIEDEYLDKRKLFLRVLPNAYAGSPRAATMHAAFCEIHAGASRSGQHISDVCPRSQSLVLTNCGGGSTKNGETSLRAPKKTI